MGSPQEKSPPISPVRSPPSDAEDHTASPLQQKTNNNSTAGVDAVTGSPAEDRTSPPKQKGATATAFPGDENVNGSPARSPSPASGKLTVRQKEKSAVAVVPFPRTASIRAEAVTGSPVRSPKRDGANDSPVRSLLRDAAERQAAQAELLHQYNSSSSVSSFGSSHRDSPQRKDNALSPMVREAFTVGSILGSPLGNMATGNSCSPEKTVQPTVAVTNRMVTRETATSARIGGRGGGGRGSPIVESGTIRQPAIRKAAIGLRICAWALSLISFSVMAADKTSGWDGDSFDRYREFRYCLSMNVLVFVYSSFQLYLHVHFRITNKWIVNHHFSYYFDFCMDQILAYLLMSASSSAASRNGDWVSNFGSDKFTKGISGSVTVSFLAFFALASSSVISTSKFFSWIS